MTDASIQIRVATPADIAALAEFAARNFSLTFTHYTPEDLAAHLEKTCSEAYFAAALQTPTTTTLVATDNRRLIGYTMVGRVILPAPSPVDARACEIYRLYVAPEYHGQKIGQALLAAVFASPIARVAPAVYLSVWSENHKAQQFYAKQGFAAVGEYLYPVGAHLDQEIILCKSH